MAHSGGDRRDLPRPRHHDAATLDALEQALGRDGLQDIFAVLETEMVTMVADLRAAAASGDAATAKGIAHTMKSNALLFGAAALAAQCRAIELAFAAGDRAAVIAQAPTVASGFEALVREVIEMRR